MASAQTLKPSSFAMVAVHRRDRLPYWGRTRARWQARCLLVLNQYVAAVSTDVSRICIAQRAKRTSLPSTRLHQYTQQYVVHSSSKTASSIVAVQRYNTCLYLHSHACELFVLSPKYLFVRALSGEMLKLVDTGSPATPHWSRSVRARSVPSRVRRKPSRLFLFGGSWWGNSPGFRTRGVILYVHTGNLSSVFPPRLSRRAHTLDIHQVDYNVAGHTPCVCDVPRMHCCMYWCGWICFYEPAVRNPPSTSLCCLLLYVSQTYY